MRGLAYAKATKYQLDDPERFVDTMACESWEFTVVDGQSYIKDPGGPNGRENSWGIAQFNFPTGLENSDGSTITMSDARDPERALDAAAFNFSIGNAERWSCY